MRFTDIVDAIKVCSPDLRKTDIVDGLFIQSPMDSSSEIKKETNLIFCNQIE